MCVVVICARIVFASKDPEGSSGSLTGLPLPRREAAGDRRVRFDYLIKKRFDAGQMPNWPRKVSQSASPLRRLHKNTY
jgi:hypothetical protein